jgi:hypothetical protein
MAFVAVRAVPSLRSAAPAKSSRSSRPAAGVPSITARCRPFFSQAPRAFYRNAGVWDDAAADAMRVSAAEDFAVLLLSSCLGHAVSCMHMHG